MCFVKIHILYHYSASKWFISENYLDLLHFYWIKENVWKHIHSDNTNSNNICCSFNFICITLITYQFTLMSLARKKKSKILEIINLPFTTCTRMLPGFALLGLHVYKPESAGTAFCIINRLDVSRPFSVTRLIPPRGESKLISWKKN